MSEKVPNRLANMAVSLSRMTKLRELVEYGKLTTKNFSKTTQISPPVFADGCPPDERRLDDHRAK